MSVFVDSTLLRFTKDTFVADMLTNGLGLAALFNATFTASDVELKSIILGPVLTRSFKEPVFENLRMHGTDERIIPDTQRVRKEQVIERFGRLDWIDIAFDFVLLAKTHALVAPLQSLTVTSLEAKLGGIASISDLRSKLLALYAPSVVDDMFERLHISTLQDFQQQRHLFIQLVGATPAPFDPNDPANAHDFTVSACVKVADDFNVSAALQSAKLCRGILENQYVPDSPHGVERTTPYAFVTLFADAAVSDTSLPGMTKLQAQTAVRDLFSSERMFAHFVT